MSVFDKAKKLEKAAPATKKNDKPEKIAVQGLGNYAIVDKVVKAFTALQKALGESVKEDMKDTFLGVAKQTKKRPENFRGFDVARAGAEASCELRSRSSRSPLTPEEAELLEGLKIPVEEVTEQEDCYVINPAYFSDSKLLEQVSKALEKVKGLPEDFILHQTAVKKKIVSDETIEAVFAKGLGESLIDIVCVTAIKPKYEGSLADAVEATKALVGLAEESEKAEKKKGKK